MVKIYQLNEAHIGYILVESTDPTNEQKVTLEFADLANLAIEKMSTKERIDSIENLQFSLQKN